MMKFFIISLFFLLLPWRAMTQDEHYFRQIFSGELARKEDTKIDKKYYSFVHGPYYDLDLNFDLNPEQLLFVKKDGEDWIEIYQTDKIGKRQKIFSYHFDNIGFDSELYRIEFKKISTLTSILILYYFEGHSRYVQSQSTARIYVVSFDNNDLKTMKAFKGPAFYEEYKSLKGHYHLRNYQIYLEDLNHDNVKELIVKYNQTSQVFIYDGNGLWKTFRN